MPMLTTLRIGSPVWPRHSPPRTRSQNADIRSRTSWTSLDHVGAVDDERALARHPQRDVEHRAVLGDVDALAAEHRLAPLGEPAFLGQRDQQPDRLVGDPVLGVVEPKAGGLGDETLAALGVGGEELAQVAVGDLGVVALQRPPAVALA